MPDFARRAKLLYDLLKITDNLRQSGHKPCGKRTNGGQVSPKQNIHWTEQHQTALIDLIDCLVQPPVMAYPKFDKLSYCMLTHQVMGLVLFFTKKTKTRNFEW